MDDKIKYITLETTDTHEMIKFRIDKFDVISGAKIARLLISKCAPLGVIFKDGEKKSGLAPEDLMPHICAALDSLTDDEVENLMRRCFSKCSIVLPAGSVPLINPQTGGFADGRVEYDLKLALKLCVETIKFGAGAFFTDASPVTEQVAPVTYL